jgi:RNA polymerase sigma-70 factor, ECF subfamily
MTDTAEELTIARAARGDQRSFEQLYRAYAAQVHGLCLRMTRSPSLAEDCTQMAFIQAWKSLPRFERRSAFGTWLHRIAVNVVLDQRRSRRNDAPAPYPDEQVEQEIVFDTPMEVAEIEAAIDSLPDGARDVLVLSGIYGYSHTETAAMLGVAEGTCKAQLHRARRRLRDHLDLEAMP